MRALAVVVLLTLPALADSKGLLRKGRDLQGAKKYAEAIAAFEEALKLQPDDPTVLGELGWTAYLMKDYAKAKTATQKAVAHQAAPNIRGATFYNLGLIDEAQGDTAGAAAAYAESLRARPNKTVRAALRKLDPKAAQAFDPYLPTPLAGPFPSIAAYCKSLPAKRTTEFEGTNECECFDVPEAEGSRKLAAPFEKVTIFRRGCGYAQNDDGLSQFGWFEYKVAVKVASGWFVETVGDQMLIGHGDESFRIDSVKAPALTSAPSVAVAYRIKGVYSHKIQSNDWDRTEVLLFGIGASGKPSATPPIVRKRLEIDEYENSGPIRHYDVALDLAWGADTLTVTAKKSTGLDAATSSDLIGVHRIAFP